VVDVAEAENEAEDYNPFMCENCGS